MNAPLLRVAAAAVGEHRVRSALGAIGVALAVGVSLTSLGINEGTRRAAQAQVDRLGIDTVAVTALTGSLSIEDAVALRDRLPGVRAVSEVIEERLPANGTLHSRTIAVSGVSGAYSSIRTIALARGRFVSATDEFSGARVCVLGERLALDLAGPAAEGSLVRIGSNWFRVIGVMSADSPDADAAFVPLSALLPQRAVMNPSQPVSSLRIQMPVAIIRTAEPAIREVLAERHGAARYDVVVARDLLHARSRTQTMFVRVSAVTGLLLFVLGGAAIANALLSSVLERIPEIGVRRAVGAARREIARQFLLEATLISIAGTAAGTVAGLSMIALAAGRGWEVAVPLAAIPAIPLAAGLVAVVAGTYPALRAAAVEPIEALSRS